MKRRDWLLLFAAYEGAPDGLDPFLFLLSLGALAFVTWAFALTWWVTGSVVPLALALASIVPAFFLFYLRDA